MNWTNRSRDEQTAENYGVVIRSRLLGSTFTLRGKLLRVDRLVHHREGKSAVIITFDFIDVR